MNNGFTLVEVLVAVAISGILITGIYSAFEVQQDSFLIQDQVAEMQQNLRAGVSFMAQEIRMAGYDPERSGTAGITTATAGTFAFTHVADNDGIDNDNADGDNDSNTGADEPGELRTLQYDLYDAYGDGDQDLGRTVGATRDVIAENFDRMEFSYLLEDDTVTTAPTAAQLEDIRAVRIALLARTDNPARDYTDTNTYTTPAGTVWGPFNDPIRRRFQVVTVKCRNMGL